MKLREIFVNKQHFGIIVKIFHASIGMKSFENKAQFNPPSGEISPFLQ